MDEKRDRPSPGHRAHLTARELAERLRVSAKTVANWRTLRQGPAYVRLGNGRVRYPLEEIESWEHAETTRHER